MPITKSAKKKLRQDKKRRKVNLLTLNKIRTELKKYKKSPSKKQEYTIFGLLDIALKKKLLHANKVARMKSNLTKTHPSSSPISTTKTKKKK